MRERVLVIDCRHDLGDPDAGSRAYAQGHIPGSAFLHLDRDLSGPKDGLSGRHPLPEAKQFAETLAGLGADESTVIIGVDASAGIYAARLWWMCRWIGHLRCGVLDGGMQQGAAADGPLSTDPFEPPRRGLMTVRPSLAPLWTLDHVEAWVGSGFNSDIAQLIDARAPERFRGEVEPLDPVAGHIPGACNRVFAHNLDAGGRFKQASVLRDEFDALLEGRDPMAVVHTCGSGVTACHNLLAMEIAGLAGSALYAGSWSEWCSKPDRPVARGQ
jgi:thiosulfate/3-mercaptopyruvate sulfurtransferase